jgi:hypothetical protein
VHHSLSLHAHYCPAEGAKGMSDVLRFREIGPARPLFSLRKRRRRNRVVVSLIALTTVVLAGSAALALTLPV